jgi:hypothetical protein
MSSGTRMVRRLGRRTRRTERASGLLSTVIGVACVAGVLGLAVNVALGLWTRSTVDAVAYDAARDLATAPAGLDRNAAAPEVIRSALDTLGPYGSRVRMELEAGDGTTVVLRVRAPGVALLPAFLEGGPTVGDVDRRVVVRVEQP